MNVSTDVAGWSQRLAVAALVTAIFTVSCASPTQPTSIAPAPAITCPAAPAVMATNGQSAVVTFGVPAVTGGTAPVTTACTPASGSVFRLGSTIVTCTATDASRRTSSCTFTASVTPSLRLGVTRILAFGDSITAGEVPVAGEFSAGIRPLDVELPNSYPADLTVLLSARYTAQGASRIDALTWNPINNSTDCSTDPPVPATAGIVVINAGCLGEEASDPGTLTRLNDKIAVYHPDLMLLLEGVNDLNQGVSIPTAVQGVQTLIRAAQSHGVVVLVGTLLPEISTDVNGGAAGLIVPFNAQLVPAVTATGARIVDLYSDIAADVTDWISPFDGLHPTEAGYQEIARVWFNAIQSSFEVSPVSAAAKPVRGAGSSAVVRPATGTTGQ